MENKKKLTKADLAKVTGGSRYYGNGVTCGKHKCTVNCIRSVALAGRIHFPKKEEVLIIDLGVLGQRAGLNGVYMADFSDKSQFYSIFEEIPRH